MQKKLIIEKKLIVALILIIVLSLTFILSYTITFNKVSKDKSFDIKGNSKVIDIYKKLESGK